MLKIYSLLLNAALIIFFALLCAPKVLGASNTSISSSYINITLNSLGTYTINSQLPAWKLGGNINATPSAITTNSGSDNIGSYQEIDFNYQDALGASRSGGIRNYNNRPVVLFNDTYNTQATNSAAFPQLSVYPGSLYHVSYQYAFAQPTFSKFNGDGPWMFYDGSSNAFVFSPASNFMQAGMTKSGKTIISGINSSITSLPAGFSHKTMLVVGQGITNTMNIWGKALTDLSGKTRPQNDADKSLNNLGYWTDHGGTYYYNYDTTLGYAGTLLAVKNSFSQENIPLGYIQLDSWWYPKGSTDIWSNHKGGIYTYTADPTLFPNGLLSFENQIGIPLITHAKAIDASSPYRSQYSMSLNVSTDPNYWSSIASYLHSSGVTTYEQDWLSSQALPAMNLTDPDAFMNNMASGMATSGLTMQYSMPLPRHFLQSSLYNNLTSIRVSGDRFSPTTWNNFFYTSNLASSLGIWPWSDVFMSTEQNNLLLSNLSAGPVGVGDAIGSESAQNLFKVIRSDGVIVKPDTPIVPVDSMYIQDAQGLTANPFIAAADTDFGSGMKAVYVFAYARGSNTGISITPGNFGLSGNTYVYNYFSGTGAVIPSGGSFSDNTTTNGTYYIIVPIGQSGIGFLGDQGKFVSLGKKRVSSVSDSGQVQAAINFAPGESSVTIYGYSPAVPVFTASDGSVGNTNYNSTTNIFTATVTPGADNLAVFSISHN